MSNLQKPFSKRQLEKRVQEVEEEYEKICRELDRISDAGAGRILERIEEICDDPTSDLMEQQRLSEELDDLFHSELYLEHKETNKVRLSAEYQVCVAKRDLEQLIRTLDIAEVPPVAPVTKRQLEKRVEEAEAEYQKICRELDRLSDAGVARILERMREIGNGRTSDPREQKKQDEELKELKDLYGSALYLEYKETKKGLQLADYQVIVAKRDLERFNRTLAIAEAPSVALPLKSKSLTSFFFALNTFTSLSPLVMLILLRSSSSHVA
jgi:hypothetical protein